VDGLHPPALRVGAVRLGQDGRHHLLSAVEGAPPWTAMDLVVSNGSLRLLLAETAFSLVELLPLQNVIKLVIIILNLLN